MKIPPGKIAELAGLAAVMLSLLFVGTQLVMDRELALAGQYHNRAETRIDAVRIYFESESLIDQKIGRFDRGLRPEYWTDDLEQLYLERIETDGEIAKGDIFRDEYRAQLQVLGFDNIHFQFERGFITESFWLNTRSAMKRYMREPMYRKIYSIFILRQEFRDEIATIGLELDAESDT